MHRFLYCRTLFSYLILLLSQKFYWVGAFERWIGFLPLISKYTQSGTVSRIPLPVFSRSAPVLGSEHVVGGRMSVIYRPTDLEVNGVPDCSWSTWPACALSQSTSRLVTYCMGLFLIASSSGYEEAPTESACMYCILYCNSVLSF